MGHPLGSIEIEESRNHRRISKELTVNLKRLTHFQLSIWKI